MIDVEIIWGGKNHPVHLPDGEHSVGRSRENDIHIPIARVSKKHAMVRVDGERIFVRDLGSTNGTEVNGTRIGSAEVEVPQHGSVSFAGALLMWSTAGAPSTASLTNHQDVSSAMSYSPTQGFSPAARDRILDFSSGLFELLASEGRGGEVEEAACRFVGQVVSADRVVMLDDQGEATSIEARARWIRAGDSDAPLRLSSTLVGQVLQKRHSILVANPMEDPNYTGQESIMALDLRSAMAAPLFDNERVRGILYVDTASPNVRYTKDDLQVLTATANAVAVKLRNLSLEKELKTAARIQRAMLPRDFEPPPGYDLSAHQVMCRAVGGDLYNFLRRPDGNFFFALGDVSGKGMPAALAMGAATVLIGMLAEIGGEIEHQATLLHHQLFRSLGPSQFVTLFLGEIHPETGLLRYVNAGHDAPLLLRENGSFQSLDSNGMPVALLEEIEFQHDEITVDPGDLLAIFSDGIPEATTDGDSFLGIEPIKEILLQRKRDPLERISSGIIERVASFLGGEPASDDVTLMLFRRNADS